MKNKKNKNIEELTSEILGNAFIGNLFDISNDIDNTSQNLVTYLELDNIKNLSKEYKFILYQPLYLMLKWCIIK